MGCRKVGKILRTETLTVKYNLIQLCHDYRKKHDCPRVGGTQPIFGYRWAAEDLKTWPCLGQKLPKIHTLFRTTPSVLLPWSWLGQRTKSTLEQIHVVAIAFVDRFIRNYIPCLGLIHTKLYTLFRIERSKTILCAVAHPRIGQIREYPLLLGDTHSLTVDSYCRKVRVESIFNELVLERVPHCCQNDTEASVV